MRGAVVQLLGRLSVLKGSNLIWSKLWVGNARGQWIPFSNQEKDKAAKKEEWASLFKCCAQDTVGL